MAPRNFLLVACGALLALSACRARKDVDATPEKTDADVRAPLDGGAPVDAGGSPTFAHHPHEWLTPARPGELPQAALAIGIVDEARAQILAEVTVPETQEVTLGSRADSTLVIPARYGIESRILVKDRALVFLPKERVLVYRKSGPEALSVTSPLPIKERLIVEVGALRFLVKPASLPDAGH